MAKRGRKSNAEKAAMAANGEAPATTAQPAKKSGTSALHKALDFVSPVIKATGEVYETHISIMGKYVIAYDGKMALAHPVDEEFTCFPQGEKLRSALTACKGNPTLSLAENGRFVVSDRRLTVRIPCVTIDDMRPVTPDVADAIQPPPDFIKSLFAAGELAREGAENLVDASIYVHKGFTFGLNNRRVMLAVYHGFFADAEPMCIPKAAIALLAKMPEPLFMAYSKESMTFWFEGNSFLYFRLYQDEWPDAVALVYDEEWSKTSLTTEIDDDFKEAVKKLKEFDFEVVTFDLDKIMIENEIVYTLDTALEARINKFSLTYIADNCITISKTTKGILGILSGSARFYCTEYDGTEKA